MTTFGQEPKNTAKAARREWQSSTGAPIPLLIQQNIGQFPEGVCWGIEREDHQVLFYENKVVFSTLGSNLNNRALELQWSGKLSARRPDCLSSASAKGRLIGQHCQKPFCTAKSIIYRDIAAGTDLIFVTDNGYLRFEIRIRAGSALKAIAFRIRNAELRIDSFGRLIARTKWGQLVQEQPRFITTESDGQKRDIPGGYRIHHERSSYGFHTEYTSNDGTDLLIDPELSFSSYIGDEGEGWSTHTSPLLAAQDQRCDVILPSVRMAGRTPHLTHCRIDCSDTSTLVPISITVIQGIVRAQDIASAGQMGCYLLTSGASGFQPPTITNTPLDNTSNDSAVLHLGPDGGLVSYTFLNQDATSITSDPSESPISAYIACNISPASLNPYGTLPFVPPVPSALLLKLDTNLSVALWGATVGGALGLGVTRVETEWSRADGQGRCDACAGLVAITGWTSSPDFPNTVTFGQPLSQAVFDSETEQRAFIALIDGTNGRIRWSGTKQYENGMSSFGIQVSIAINDRSVTWLTHQLSGPAWGPETLDRIDDNGSLAHPSTILDAGTGYHWYLAVQDDATCWLMGDTFGNGLASADALQHEHGGDRDVFIRSVNSAGMHRYCTYIGGPGREVPLSLDWADDHLYGLLDTTSGSLSTSAEPQAPFRQNYRAPSDTYLFIISTNDASRLEVSKTCSVPNAQVGDLFTYTVSLTNTGSTPIQDIRLRDQASSEIALLESTPWLSNGNSLEIEIPLLAASSTQSWDIDAVAFSSGCASNSVQVITQDGSIVKTITLTDMPCIHDQAMLAIRFIASGEQTILFEVENTSDSTDAMDYKVRHSALGTNGLVQFEFESVAINMSQDNIIPAPALDANITMPASSYIITFPRLPARGRARVVAIPRSLKTASYGTKLELMNGSGQVLDALTQDFTVGNVVDANLILELLEPSTAELGSTANLPYQLSFRISRGSNDPGNPLPDLTMNVEFTVPSGSIPPDSFVLFPQSPEQLTLSSGGNGTSLRRLMTETARGDLWLATFLIPGSAMLPNPGASVDTHIDLVSQIGIGPHFARYSIRAFLEGPITIQAPRVWESS